MIRILLSGPPASGKSVLAKQLAARYGAEVVDFDEIAREMGSQSHHDHPEAVRAATREEIDRRVDGLNGSAIVIRSAPTPAEREAIAHRIGARSVVVLAVPAVEAKRRAAADGRPGWTNDAIDRWWARYQPSPIDEPQDETDPRLLAARVPRVP